MRVRFNRFFKYARDGVEVLAYPAHWEGDVADEIGRRVLSLGVAEEIKADKGQSAPKKQATAIDERGTKG